MQKERSAGVVVFFENGERKYLLLLYGEGHWDYIKGHIEEGEGDVQTARREAEEEAGLRRLEFVDGFKSNISYFFRRGKGLVSKEVIFLLARAKETNVSLSFEHKDFSWLSFKDALERLTFKNARNVLQESEDFLNVRSTQRRLEDFGGLS